MIQAIIVCLFGLLLPSMMMASSFFEEDAIAGYRLLFAIKTAATKPQPIERALKTNMETGKIYVYPSARFFIPACVLLPLFVVGSLFCIWQCNVL